jgi:hypothetical protein
MIQQLARRKLVFEQYVGQSLKRTEDARLIRGQGQYVVDIIVERALEALCIVVAQPTVFDVRD